MQVRFHRFSPFRPPGWRFDRVLQMIDNTPVKRCVKSDDEYVRRFREFVLRYRSADQATREQLAWRDLGVFLAYQLYSEQQVNNRMITIIESRILNGCTDQVIADELGTRPEMIRWYSAMFFDVRGRLKNTGWIVDRVLMPAYEAAINAGLDQTMNQPQRNNNNDPDNPQMMTFNRSPLSEPFFDPTTKMFAYFGGPAVLDYILQCGFHKGVIAQGKDDVAPWLDNHTFTRLKHRSAMAAQNFEVNRFNVMDLFQVHIQIKTMEQAAAGDGVPQSQLLSNIAATLKGLNWAVGEKGRKLITGKPVERYDDAAAELRTHEMLELSSGRKPRTMDGIEKLALPAPRKPTGQEDQHADAQQGS